MKKETWLCSYCEMRNPAEATVCQFCKTGRKTETAPSKATHVPVKPEGAEINKETWLCSYCEMPNARDTAICQFCHRDRSGKLIETPEMSHGRVYFPGGGHRMPAERNPLKGGNLVFGKKPEEPKSPAAVPVHKPDTLPGAEIAAAVRETAPKVGSPIVFPTVPDTETVYADASLPPVFTAKPEASLPAIKPSEAEVKPWEPEKQETPARPAGKTDKKKISLVHIIAWALILLLLAFCIYILISAVITG